MNQFDVIDNKTPLRGILYPKHCDLSSKIDFLEPNLVGSESTMWNLNFLLIVFLDSNNLEHYDNVLL